MSKFLELVRPHAYYLAMITLGVLGFRSWLAEHDQEQMWRVQSNTAQTTIADLREQIDQRDKVATSSKQVIVRELAAAKTPQQQVAVIPNLSVVELHPRLMPFGPGEVATAQVDLAPLVAELSKCKQNNIEWAVCEKDREDLDRINLQQQNEIKVLKKKPEFWHRLASDVKKIGFGVMAGAVITAVVIH